MTVLTRQQAHDVHKFEVKVESEIKVETGAPHGILDEAQQRIVYVSRSLWNPTTGKHLVRLSNMSVKARTQGLHWLNIAVAYCMLVHIVDIASCSQSVLTAARNMAIRTLENFDRNYEVAEAQIEALVDPVTKQYAVEVFPSRIAYLHNANQVIRRATDMLK